MPIGSYKKEPSYGREPWMKSGIEPVNVWDYCLTLGYIQSHLHCEPIISGRKHNGASYLTIQIPVDSLGDALGSTSIPSERYPNLREIISGDIPKREGLIFMQESEIYPYVRLEYRISIQPKKEFSWTDLFK